MPDYKGRLFSLIKPLFRILWLVWILAALTGCSAPKPASQNTIAVTILADNKQASIQAPPGITVQEALDQAKIQLNTLDRIDPPSYTVLDGPMTIKVTRVREEFQVEEVSIEFERQTVRNESLPEGQTLLIQSGSNGVRQITYRQVVENDVPGPRTVFKTLTLSEPKPEIVMVGVQTPFTAVPISGKIAYITAGNAWIMETSTANRRPLVTSGDLDGHIFDLSSDGAWLLFSRKSEKAATEEINTLWAVSTAKKDPKPISLRVKNVVHFAAWQPGKTLTLAYSTVEPRATAPGWQANNDLYLLRVNPEGIILKQDQVLEPNSGGIYGWWGMDFTWSPDGKLLSYARPDSLGLVNLEDGTLVPLLDLTPLQTHSDWAWVPELGWSPDHQILYSVTHAPMAGVDNNEASPLFDLTAVLMDGGIPIDLVPQSGMFAYPSASPMINSNFLVAYLQAVFPDRSDTSRYRLVIMRQNGSNRQTIFPPEGSPGLQPQKLVWSPFPSGADDLWLALTYQGNLWLLNSKTDQAQQITGDGSINVADWK
jgi:resuscitation-promoting factor RpfB